MFSKTWGNDRGFNVTFVDSEVIVLQLLVTLILTHAHSWYSISQRHHWGSEKAKQGDGMGTRMADHDHSWSPCWSRKSGLYFFSREKPWILKCLDRLKHIMAGAPWYKTCLSFFLKNNAAKLQLFWHTWCAWTKHQTQVIVRAARLSLRCQAFWRQTERWQVPHEFCFRYGRSLVQYQNLDARGRAINCSEQRCCACVC